MQTSRVWIENQDYYVHGVPFLPNGIGGTTTVGPDGGYNIHINTSLSLETQDFSLYHEFAHVLLGHIDDPNYVEGDPVYDAEANAFVPKARRLYRRWHDLPD